MKKTDLDLFKRYYIFKIPDYYPSGGMYDLEFTTDDESEALDLNLKFNKEPYYSSHVYDTLEKVFIYRSVK